MRSMWRFMEEKNAARGIRLSIEPFGNQQNIDAVPLAVWYMKSKIRL